MFNDGNGQRQQTRAVAAVVKKPKKNNFCPYIMLAKNFLLTSFSFHFSNNQSEEKKKRQIFSLYFFLFPLLINSQTFMQTTEKV